MVWAAAFAPERANMEAGSLGSPATVVYRTTMLADHKETMNGSTNGATLMVPKSYGREMDAADNVEVDNTTGAGACASGA